MKVKELISLLQSEDISPESEVRLPMPPTEHFSIQDIVSVGYVMHPAFDEWKYVELQGGNL